MKKFRFRLQRLLDLKEMREQEIKNELARVVGKQNLERLKQQELHRRIGENSVRIKDLMRENRITGTELIMSGQYRAASLRAIDVAEDRIKALEPEVQRVRVRLVEASKEKKVVEKLKERRYNEYMGVIDREIAKENDDMNQKIYQQRRREEQAVNND